MDRRKEKAVRRYMNDFNHIPGVIFEEIAKAEGNEGMGCYDDDMLRILASPEKQCYSCDCRDVEDGEACPECGEIEEEWPPAHPQLAFPVAWGTMFHPRDSCDQDWIAQNAEAVAELGIYVFESDLFDGVLLGIDAGGFDFYEAYWEPLYDLRGLKWHENDRIIPLTPPTPLPESA